MLGNPWETIHFCFEIEPDPSGQVEENRAKSLGLAVGQYTAKKFSMIGGTPFKKTQQHSRPRVLLFGGLKSMTFSTTFLLASQCLSPFFSGPGSDCQRLSLASLGHLRLASRGFSALDARAVVPPIPTQRKIPCILNRSWKFSSNPRQVLIVEVGVCERNSTNVLSLESQVIGFFFPFFFGRGPFRTANTFET